MRVVITGIRDLDPRDETTVRDEMRRIVEDRPEEIIFGGARGVDTMALLAAATDRRIASRLLVIVPGRAAQQPQESRAAISMMRPLVFELGLDLDDPASFSKRNAAMLDRALEGPPALCVAFHDGRRGGTANCIQYAKLRGIPVRVVPVRRQAR